MLAGFVGGSRGLGAAVPIGIPGPGWSVLGAGIRTGNLQQKLIEFLTDSVARIHHEAGFRYTFWKSK